MSGLLGDSIRSDGRDSLLDQLQSAHRDKKGRYKPKIEIEVGFKLSSLSNIDLIANTFECQCRLLLTWSDPAVQALFATEEGKQTGEEKWEEVIYDPQLTIKNSLGELTVIEESLKLEDGATGTVKRVWEFSGTFSYKGRYHSFPFDTQILPIRLKSNDKNKQEDQITFKPRTSVHNPILKDCTQAEYDIREPQFVHFMSDAGESSKGKRYAEIEVQFPVSRVSNYYVTNILLLSTSIALLSCAAFAIEPGSMGDRMGIVLTLLLTFVALKFVISDSLPKIPYNTAIDWYLLLNFIILYIVALENWLIVYFLQQDEDTALLFDNAFLGFVLISLVVINALFILYASCGRRAGPVVLPRLS